jgi:hypothetical protein
MLRIYAGGRTSTAGALRSRTEIYRLLGRATKGRRTAVISQHFSWMKASSCDGWQGYYRRESQVVRWQHQLARAASLCCQVVSAADDDGFDGSKLVERMRSSGSCQELKTSSE